MPFGGSDPSTCPTCDSTGYVDGELCTICFGGGTTDLRGTAYHTLKYLYDLTETLNDLVDTASDILDKCNDIFEQVSE